ncbi:MAG: hypothetical protein ACE5NA_13310, partial [Nitrospiraceae bacterium]
MASVLNMRGKVHGILNAIRIFSVVLSIGCATILDPKPEKLGPAEGATFGRVQTALAGPTTRVYLPEL